MRLNNLVFIVSIITGLILCSANYSTGEIIDPLPKPAFPSYGAVHETSKIKASINGHGVLGYPVRNPISGELYSGFYLPHTDEIRYMGNGAFWVGGIVGEDTLVSVSFSKERRFVSTYGGWQTIFEYELYPTHARDSLNAVNYYQHNGADVFHMNLVDTIWGYIPPPNVYSFNLNYDHWPMGLEITQKTYSKNISPYKNIVLLDYTITNISNEEISNLTAGIFLDPDICGNCVDTFSTFNWGVFDDMVGSIRELGIGYMIDNDGDPGEDMKFNKFSPLDAIALMPVISSTPMNDTSFNWWGAGELDYGPRSSTLAYPDFGGLIFGTPAYDGNKYFVMNNHEWDYDQVDIWNLPQTDPDWEIPNIVVSSDYYDGYDSRFLLSLNGPALKPDSSIRIIFALFGAEYVHLNPNNTYNLSQKKIEEYKSNLFEQIIRSNADYANAFAAEVLNPALPPLGLHQVKAVADSVYLQWDCWGFDDVVGYNIYYKPLPDSLVFAPGYTIPAIKWDDISTTATKFETNYHKQTIPELVPGKMYLAVVSHQTINGEGALSAPIVIGQNNYRLNVSTPKTDYKFTTHYRDSDTVQITWTDEQNDDIEYYKIYRTSDSLFSENRYYPFIAGDEYSAEYFTDRCLNFNDSSYCLYRIPAYDSIPGDQLLYNDINPITGGIYWLSAVSQYGYESGFSERIFSIEDFEPINEIVVVMGSGFNETDFAYADSIISFYNRVLEGYTYDIFNWYDTNLDATKCPDRFCTNPEDIAKYKHIIIEEFPTPYLLSREFEAHYGFFTQIALMGRNIIYFGLPPGDDLFNLSTVFSKIDYREESFQHTFMGLDSIWLRPWLGSYNELKARDSLAGFHQAMPISDQPQLTVTASNFFYKDFMSDLFNLFNVAPMTPAFFPSDSSEILYTYHSYFPETSELEGFPCGIKSTPFRANVYSFPFHLWTIQETDARNLIDYIIADVRFQPAPDPLPERFELAQNYPNPFNPTTKIEFDLPKASRVTLEIFNILGQKVKTISSNESMAAGTYIKEWNGKDDSNSPVASGIYLYRLSTGEFSSSKKMMLLK